MTLPGQSQTAHWCDMLATLRQQKPDTGQVHRNACCKKERQPFLKFRLTQNKKFVNKIFRPKKPVINKALGDCLIMPESWVPKFKIELNPQPR